MSMFKQKGSSESGAPSRTSGAVVLVLSVVFLPSLYAFELLSEGAMDSVSAVSAQSVEDIISIAGSPAAGLSDDYDALPFQTSVQVAEGETDEVQTELNFKLTQEVEAWADELRRQGERQLDVGVVEELSPSSQDSNPFASQTGAVDIEAPQEEESEDDDERTTIRQERISRRFEQLESGVDSLTTRFERYVERAETINANPDNELSSIGSGFISESISRSTQVYSNYRGTDRDLFGD